MFSSGGTMVRNATQYLAASYSSASESFAESIVPVAVTFGHMYCFGPTPGGTTTDVFTVYQNGSAVSTATCTIPTGGSSPVSTPITLSLNPGDRISVRVDLGNNGGPATAALYP
jgi:hypothetical protein